MKRQQASTSSVQFDDRSDGLTVHFTVSIVYIVLTPQLFEFINNELKVNKCRKKQKKNSSSQRITGGKKAVQKVARRAWFTALANRRMHFSKRNVWCRSASEFWSQCLQSNYQRTFTGTNHIQLRHAKKLYFRSHWYWTSYAFYHSTCLASTMAKNIVKIGMIRAKCYVYFQTKQMFILQLTWCFFGKWLLKPYHCAIALVVMLSVLMFKNSHDRNYFANLELKWAMYPWIH